MINATGTFTRKLREQIQPDYEQIINCAFVRRLTDGTLPRSWFIHYVSQDMRYIIADSKALAATAARAENADEMYFLLQMAKDGLDIEREIRDPHCHGRITCFS
jgi:thiaminase/transcriptional activator TenA